MRLRLLGITMTPGIGITLPIFFDHLAGLRGERMELEPYNRLIYTEPAGEHQLGLFITVKDQRRFFQLVDGGHALTVLVSELESDKSLMDFNFFVVHRQTGRGLYQYYHNSCSLNTFGRFCRSQYAKLHDNLLRERIHAISAGSALTKAKERAAKAQYKGSLEVAQMVRKEAFEGLVEELSSIKTIDLTFTTMDAPETMFGPLGPYVKRRRHSFSIHKRSATAKVRESLMEVIRASAPSSASVAGRGEDGLERVIRLANNPDSFGETTLDEVSNEMTFKLDEFSQSPLLSRMRSLMDQHPAHFSTPETP